MVLKSQTLHYAELLQVSLKEDLVYNGYSLFAEKVISKPQYVEEFISLVTTLSAFECHKGRRVFVQNKSRPQEVYLLHIIELHLAMKRILSY